MDQSALVRDGSCLVVGLPNGRQQAFEEAFKRVPP